MNSGTNFHTRILYNTICRALNSYNLHRCLGLYENQTPRKTYRLILENIYQSATIDIHKIFDDPSGYDVSKLINIALVEDDEKQKIIKKWEAIKSKYPELLMWIKQDRHNQVAHISKSLEKYSKNNKPVNEYLNIAKPLNDAKNFLESLDWFKDAVPAVQKPFTDKEFINELRLYTRRESKRAEMQAILEYFSER